MKNRLIRYFDLQSERREGTAVSHGAQEAHAPVLPQYLALILGIIVQPFLNYYVEHGMWSIDLSVIVGRFAFSLIVGAIVFPAVYKNAFDPGKPTFVQYCAVFSAGIGWQSLIQGSAKVTGLG